MSERRKFHQTKVGQEAQARQQRGHSEVPRSRNTGNVETESFMI